MKSCRETPEGCKLFWLDLSYVTAGPKHMIAAHELKKIPLLSLLSDDELRRLCDVLKERRAPKGSFILYADDPGPSLMFIAEGKVKINLVGSDGSEIVLANLHAGDFFGEIAVLTGEDRSANVVALADCKLLVLCKADFEKHVLHNSGLTLALLRELALRLRTASSKIGDLALLDVYRRIARTLQLIAEPQELHGEKVFVIESRPTHQELAAMVGTSREMVSRAFKGLEEDGCIILEGKRVIIKKLPA